MEIGSSADRPGFIIGVDIGGTKVAGGLVAPSGEIRYHTRVPMAATVDRSRVLLRLLKPSIRFAPRPQALTALAGDRYLRSRPAGSE